MKRKGFNTVNENSIDAEILDFDSLDTSATKTLATATFKRSNIKQDLKKSSKQKVHYPKIACNEYTMESSRSHKECLISLVKIVFDKEMTGLKSYFSSISLPLSKTSKDGILESLIDILQHTATDIEQNSPQNLSFVRETKARIESDTEELVVNLDQLKHSLDFLTKYEKDIQLFHNQITLSSSTCSNSNKSETEDYLRLLSSLEVTCEDFLKLISDVDEKANEAVSAKSNLYNVYKLANSGVESLTSTKEIVKMLQKS